MEYVRKVHARQRQCKSLKPGFLTSTNYKHQGCQIEKKRERKKKPHINIYRLN